MPSALSKVLFGVLWAFLGSMPGMAQGYLQMVGNPAFTTPEPVELGFTNLANGNVHLEISLTSAPQRGKLGFAGTLTYDSRIWGRVGNTWQPTNVPNSQGGWRFVNPADTGSVGYMSDTTWSCIDDEWGIQWYRTDYTSFSWTSPDGTVHSFGIVTSDDYPACGEDVSSGNALADDSSGYHMYVVNFTNVTVFTRDGTQVYPEVKDTNGNFLSTDGSGNAVDTLGRTPVIKTVNGNLTYYDILDSQNSNPRKRITVTTSTINVKTAFGQSGVTEYTGTITVITSIALPDGTSYTFDYDSGTTPGFYGLIKTVTLPTGGQINYTHATFTDSYNNKNRWISTRISGGGTWTYTPSVISTCGSSCQHKVIVRAPNSDERSFTFYSQLGQNSAWNTEAKVYTGTVASGTLLSTLTTDYDFSAGENIRVTRRTSTLPISGGNLISKVEYSYDSPQNANVTSVKEWGYYTGTPPATPTRETVYTYLTSYTSKNIIDREASRTVKNSAGTQIARTEFTYDSTTLTSVTGITHHDSTGFGTGYTMRGNPTLIKVWVAGTTYLTTTKYYDITGQLVQEVDPKGNSTTFSYADNFYHDNGANPPLGYTPSQATNAYLTQTTRPLIGAETTGYYFNTGQRAFFRDQNNADTYFHYVDPLDRLTHEYSPLIGGSRGWKLIQYASVTQENTFSGISDTTPSTSCTSCTQNRKMVDGLDRTTQDADVNDPQGAVFLDSGYDTSGHLHSISNPYRTTSDPTYGNEMVDHDGLGRTTQITHQDTNYVQAYYGPAVQAAGGRTSQLCATATYGLGYPKLVIDEAGKKRQAWTNAFGKDIEIDEQDSTGALTIGTCHKYDAQNSLTEVTQASQTRTYAYDGLSRLTSEYQPETGTLNYYYTTSVGALCAGASGKICRRTDARNITTTYAFDALNRLASITYSDSTPSVTLSYDQTSYNGLTITNGKGRRTGMSDAAGLTAWSYDAAGRVIAERRTVSGITKTISYTYKLDGSLESVTYPSTRTLTYTYNNSGRPISAVDSGGINYVLNATYAPHGKQASALHGQVGGGFAGITKTDSYSNRLKPSGQTTSSANGTVLNLSYSYDLGGGANNGNVASVTNNLNTGRTATYTYDERNRIKTAASQATSGPDCWGQTFAYDAQTNLPTITVQQCSAPTLSLSLSSLNRITNTGFTYDNAGNLTNNSTQSFTWNAENRVTATAGVTYTYDGDGWRRKKSSGTLYWRDLRGNVLAESDLSGNVTIEFIYFAGKRIARRDVGSGNVYYFFSDQLGSARAMTDATGITKQESDYYPYGGERVIINTVANAYKFTGKERDSESGLDFAYYRMYSPSLGRWMSPDPVRGRPEAPQSHNLYPYVQNNPTNFVDILGNLRGGDIGEGPIDVRGAPPCSGHRFGGCGPGIRRHQEGFARLCNKGDQFAQEWECAAGCTLVECKAKAVDYSLECNKRSKNHYALCARMFHLAGGNYYCHCCIQLK